MGRVTTVQQSKIIELTAQGCSQREIAATLGISKNTVRKYSAALSFEIIRRQNELTQQLCEEARVSHAARLQCVKAITERLKERIAEADFSEIPLEKAIDLLGKLQRTGAELAFNLSQSHDFYDFANDPKYNTPEEDPD